MHVTQLGTVISWDDKPIAFDSRKRSLTQTRDTTSVKEQLAMGEIFENSRKLCG